jgi:hypothetical protein
MNNKTILTMAFLLSGILLTATMSIVPALAERDHDDDYNDRDGKDGRDGDGKDSKYGAGNKQKVEDESAGALNDCDTIKNEIEDNTFENINECIAIAATDESVVNDGNGDGDGDGNGDGNGPGEDCAECIEVFLDAVADLESITDLEEIAITAAIELFGEDCDDFSEADVEALATAILEILGTETEAELALVVDLEECLDALLEIV